MHFRGTGPIQKDLGHAERHMLFGVEVTLRCHHLLLYLPQHIDVCIRNDSERPKFSVQGFRLTEEV